MTRIKFALLGLLLVGTVLSCVGCQKEATEDETKKANSTQQPTSGAPSLGNPKPAEGTGK